MTESDEVLAIWGIATRLLISWTPGSETGTLPHCRRSGSAEPVVGLTQKCILRTLDVNKSRTESAGHPMAAD